MGKRGLTFLIIKEVQIKVTMLNAITTPQSYFQECKWLTKHGVFPRLRNWHAFGSFQVVFLISTVT